jgi:uncharacterized membrane protein AbrB (regulator of aidB expression)
MSSEKATGIAAIAGSFFSPWFWVVALVVFGLFFAASHLQNRFLRILFFWLPAGTTSLLTVASATFITYVLLQLRHS